MYRPAGAIDLLCYPWLGRTGGQLPAALPCNESPHDLVRRMNQAGIDQAFISQCKRWSCERQWICVDTSLEDVLRFTQAFPSRFLGLAGYNPYDIARSLEGIEVAVRDHGFRGVYLHAAGFSLSLMDRRMYPLFGKAVELGVPVIAHISAGHENGRRSLSQVDRVASDFDQLVLLCAFEEFSYPYDIRWLCRRRNNVGLLLDPMLLSAHAAWARAFIHSPDAQDRCCWGSHGADWGRALEQVQELKLPAATERRLLRDNVTRMFRLDTEFPLHPRVQPQTESLVAER